MKILITGANGIIGSRLTKALSAKHTVTGIDVVDKNNKGSIVLLDITEPEQLAGYFKKTPDLDVIIHLAAIAHQKGSGLTYERFKAINYQGTVNLVDQANKYLKLKCFIFASTISVYGESIKKQVYSEEDELVPQTPYAVTKSMSEKYIKDNVQSEFLILRFAPVYADNFMLNINRRTKIGKYLYRVGGGKTKLSLLNLNNILQVISFALEEGTLKGIFNVADATVYTYGDLVDFQWKRFANQKIITMPALLVRMLYGIGKILRNNFIIENTAKLLSDKIYTTAKLQHYLKLNETLTGTNRFSQG